MNFNDKIDRLVKSEGFAKILGKIKKDKRTLLIIFLALSGVLLVALSEYDYEETDESRQSYASEAIDFGETEKRLRKIIKSINGVGEVETYITYDCEYETVYAVNSETKTDEGQLQSKSEYIVTDEDTGIILKRIYPRIRGVAVVCQGGDNPVIKDKIYSLVSALFDINTNKISVADME